MNKRLEVGRAASGKRKLKDLLLKKDNRFCADCNAPDPKWASANIGVFICLKCCGVHRSLGTHMSKVLSVTLDEWSDDEIDAMTEVGGNAAANKIYEAHIPEGYSKPTPDAGHEQRSNFIRSKYELQDFLKPGLRISSGKNSLESNSSNKTMEGSRSTSGSLKTEGMVEFIGLLKVKVVKGTNLAIRDMMSSDPYVILKLGQQVLLSCICSCNITCHSVFYSLLKELIADGDNYSSENDFGDICLQTVQTTVVNSNLNPVWNEELMLSVPQEYGTLKLQVYDHDTFSADDIMGEAEIDLQPMITSAMAFGNAEMFGDMQIGKWLKSDDNALIEDSLVNIADGKILQKMTLKLQNVESGELDLELEWMPLDQ